MAPKRPVVDGPTSRKRTADMLRRLRELTRESKMLNADIEAARTKEYAGRTRRQR